MHDTTPNPNGVKVRSEVSPRGMIYVSNGEGEPIAIPVGERGFSVWYHPDCYPGQPTQFLIKQEEGACQLSGVVKVIMEDGRPAEIAEFEL